MTYLISIIIPNYNRESLIGQTLDSIISQTYQNWECIIVDDVSTDNSLLKIKEYSKKDKRFKVFQRSIDYPKGANVCRNIGLEKAKGDYIIFFDSDDLMKENHVEEKIKLISSGDFNFAITKTEYFNNPQNIDQIYYQGLFDYSITADHFIQKKICWLTCDPIIKSKIAKSIRFTEKNQSAEEYNYFVKLLLTTEKGKFKDIVLSHRRFHDESYQANLKSTLEVAKNNFNYYYDTYLEVKNNKNITKNSKRFLIAEASKVLYKNIHLLNKKEKINLYFFLLEEFGFFRGLNKIKRLLSKELF